MKHLLFSLFALATFTLTAQDDEQIKALLNGPSLAVEHTTAKLNKQPTAAFTLYLNAEDGLVEKQFATFINTRYNCEFKKDKKHYQALDIRMLDVAEGTVSLYSKTSKDENGARLDVFVQSGTRFIEPSTFPAESPKMDQMLQSFARAMYVEVYDEILVDERKEHEKLNKELDKLTKEGEKLDKEVIKSKEEIEDAQSDITKAEQEIAELKLKIEQLKLDVQNAETDITRLESNQKANNKAKMAQEELVREKGNRIERLKAKADSMRLR